MVLWNCDCKDAAEVCVLIYDFHLDENLRKQTCDPLIDGICHLVRETTIAR